jgi:hypothetical protein
VVPLPVPEAFGESTAGEAEEHAARLAHNEAATVPRAIVRTRCIESYDFTCAGWTRARQNTIATSGSRPSK